MEQDPRRRQIQRGRKHRLFASLLARLFMFLQIVDFVFILNWRGVKGILLRISILLCLVLAFTIICAKTAMFCKNIHGQLKLLRNKFIFTMPLLFFHKSCTLGNTWICMCVDVLDPVVFLVGRLSTYHNHDFLQVYQLVH
jgi:hypothetical protein